MIISVYMRVKIIISRLKER